MNLVGNGILVVGGYGGFGGRLVEALVGLGVPRIWVAGRSIERAQAYCAALGPAVKPLMFDRAVSSDGKLRELQPDIVIDAAGPFQCYGERPYSLVETCIELGINYLDLADGREFVCGITRYDARARAAGVFVLSGASSVPALSGAAIAAIAESLDAIEHIHIGISPAGGVVMGPSVLQAILSYVGKTVVVLANGAWIERKCWSDLRSERLAVGADDRLNRRVFSLCDVPDLAIWPDVFPHVKTVQFGAALEPLFNHLGVYALSWLVRLRVLRDAGKLTPLLYRLAGWLPSGVRKGGMFVKLEGTRGCGSNSIVQWTLIADGDHGPYIPTMAAEAIVRRVMSGTSPAAGARVCSSELTLADFEPAFSRHNIRTAIDDGSATAGRWQGD